MLLKKYRYFSIPQTASKFRRLIITQMIKSGVLTSDLHLRKVGYYNHIIFVFAKHSHQPGPILYDGEEFVSYCQDCGLELTQDNDGKWQSHSHLKGEVEK
jgi:hypothetical protein